MRNNFDLDMILLNWRMEANVKNGIAYSCKRPRDSDSALLTIYTAQPMRMEALIGKYHPLLNNLSIFHNNLVINIVKVDRCLH